MIKNARWIAASLSITLLVGIAAANDCCSRCGSTGHINRICQAVPDTKKVKKSTLSCKCEEICIPGRTLTHDCQPRCGRPRAVTKLMRTETTVEVPTTKWVVTYFCDQCCSQESEPLPPPSAAH